MFGKFDVYFILALLFVYISWIVNRVQAYSNFKSNKERSGKLLLSLERSKSKYYISLLVIPTVLIIFLPTLVISIVNKEFSIVLFLPVYIQMLLKDLEEYEIRDLGIVSMEGFFVWKDIETFAWHKRRNILIFNVMHNGLSKQIFWNTGKNERSAIERVLKKCMKNKPFSGKS